MCGIAGIYSFNEKGQDFFKYIEPAIDCLAARGPDDKGVFLEGKVALGHRRLAIIDTSSAGNQPMSDDRYVIVYNGEFFNYRQYRDQLAGEGFSFQSDSDTEVLLALYKKEGPAFLNKINGFFALAIYDKQEKSLFMARDRYGVKPLLFFQDEDKLMFASEMKALLAMGIPKLLDKSSLYHYFQLNYIPGENSIFENVKKIKPGHYLIVKNEKIEEHNYYSIPKGSTIENLNFKEAKENVFSLLTASVERRMISDVPLGSFLSGGVDSSIVAGIASGFNPKLKTFSIGFKDEPNYDETYYANLAAEKFKTDHTVFSLTNDDLLTYLTEILDYIDEPFADSSLIAGFILSKKTSQHVKVALSGDGADELFGGYNKHRAEYIATQQRLKTIVLQEGANLLKLFPQSRNSTFANKVRQLVRFGEGSRLNRKDRYWLWCSLSDDSDVQKLLKVNFNKEELEKREDEILRFIDNKSADLNEIFRADMKLVLPDDMLRKVDSMSMANSLEVRSPFLDYELVNYVAKLPSSFKINKKEQKFILKEAFKNLLPAEILNRSKKGFEVSLLKWFKGELHDLIFKDLLEENFIENQGLFNFREIKKLKDQLFSMNPGDAPARIWALMVFQYWWKKHLSNA